MTEKTEYEYLRHDGALYRRRKDKVSLAVDEILMNGEWQKARGDRTQPGAMGMPLSEDQAKQAEKDYA